MSEIINELNLDTSSIGNLLKYFKLRDKGKRIDDRDEYFLLIALAVASRSTCLRRNYGAVLVKNNKILSTGYNGAPSEHYHCIDKMECYREMNNIPHGKQYEDCRSVHGEQNALISANGNDLKGSTLYLMGYDCNENKLIKSKPCKICEPMLQNAGIVKVISAYEKDENLFFVKTSYI